MYPEDYKPDGEGIPNSGYGWGPCVNEPEDNSTRDQPKIEWHPDKCAACLKMPDQCKCPPDEYAPMSFIFPRGS